MSSAGHAASGTGEPQRSFLRRYIFSTDHKVVGLQCLVSRAGGSCDCGDCPLAADAASFGMAGCASSFRKRRRIMLPEQYLALVTMHPGRLWFSLCMTTAPQNAFGNYFLPIQIGAPEMAFPQPQLDFVLAYVHRVPVPACRILRARGRSNQRLDCLYAVKRIRRRYRIRRGRGPDNVDRQHIDFSVLHRC